MKKINIITLLQEQYPSYTVKQLKSFIACREVKVFNETVNNSKQMFNIDSLVSLSFEKYVSRGALKLEKAIKEFNIDITNKVILDAGASTGGFTDYLVQNGARLVHSVDVGTNQLSYKLRNNEKVISYEQTNIFDVKSLDPEPDMCVCDISFKSILTYAKHIALLSKEKTLIALIKPQFEVENNPLFDGVIKDNKLLEETLDKVIKNLEDQGFSLSKVIESPILGRKGNKEFLVKLNL